MQFGNNNKKRVQQRILKKSMTHQITNKKTKIPLPAKKSKKIIGQIEDEMVGKITRFAFRPKAYAQKIQKDDY